MEEEPKTTEGAVEPLPPSSSTSSPSSRLTPAQLLSAQEKLPAGVGKPDHQPFHPFNPKGKYYDQLMALTYFGGSGGEPPDDDEDDLWWSEQEDDEIMKRDTVNIAPAALKFYNNEEGTKYVFDEPILCNNVLFHLAMVCHANFTAREENGTSSPSQVFFAETVKYIGGGRSKVLNCVKLDAFPPDGVREGCIYCKKAIRHPPVEYCEYGQNEKDDHSKFKYDKVTSNIPSENSTVDKERSC